MSFAITEFTVDGLKDVVAIDNNKPVFAWKMADEKQNVFQESYHITVGSEYGISNMWDSGEVISQMSDGVSYQGDELLPCTDYYVKVIVKNNYGDVAEYEGGFETALLCEDFSAWNGAEFIGAPEYYVCSEALGVFALESKLKISGNGKAGIVFGADDYRLKNKELNEMLIEGENYISVCINKNEKRSALEIYRVGYSPEDKKDVPLDTIELKTVISEENEQADELSRDEIVSLKTKESGIYHLRLEVTGNCVNLYVNSEFVKRVQLNPLGDNDVTTFPRLGNIGYFVAEGTKAHFNGITCSFLRHPSEIFYTCDTDKGLEVFPEKDMYILHNPDCHALPMFRRNFTIGKNVKKARLYITARGIYECRINGKNVSDEYFAPGASQFDKHLYYQTYDVTNLICEGENGIGITLASGWWSGSQTFVLGCFNLWGDKESVMAMLVTEYEDGSTDTIVTNETDWDYYGEGAYKFAGFFQGERLDGREYEKYISFSKAGFSCDLLKKPVAIIPEIIPEFDSLPGFFRKYPEMNRNIPKLTGKPHCAVKAVEKIVAKSVTSPAEGVYIYDLGQEIAGVPEITFNGNQGETATIRYAEMLYPELDEYGELAGRLLVANLRDASSTDKYILSGKKDEIYSSRFTFHGFRYIEISGVKNPPEVSQVKGIQLSSVHDISGKVETDNELLNRFIKNVSYSQLCNFISIPTDCPQRNERMGWAGDTHVFCKTANLNADVKAFYLRYLEALRDCQDEDGNLPEIAPVGGGFGGITYGSAMAFIVNDLYEFFGDKQIIEDNYVAMKRYMDYLGGKNLPGDAYVGPIDDWLAPEKTDCNLVWNAFYGRVCRLMARFADVLGVEEDKLHFEAKAEAAVTYFNKTFFDTEKGITLNIDGSVNDTMGGYAIALAYEMFKEENISKAQKRLAEKVRESGYKITTGFFGTGLVNPCLSNGGYGTEAYKMITQTECPSWLYPVTQGATTIWERWNSYTKEKGFGGMNAMNSFNHYSLGSVLSWIYEYALGIRHLENSTGWKKFAIKPDFKGFGKISGGFETPYGRIESGYEVAGGRVKFFCSVPVNTVAEVVLPDRTETLGSGRYDFEFSAENMN